MTKYYLTFGTSDVCAHRHWTGYIDADSIEQAIPKLIDKLEHVLYLHQSGELDLDRESSIFEELNGAR